MVLSNLFENAIEYSPRGSVVEVDFLKEENSPCLVISNPASDLVLADLPHLFERFWRKDKVRKDESHFGLGLSLVKMICERLGIEMSTSLSEGVIQFRLRFSIVKTSE